MSRPEKQPNGRAPSRRAVVFHIFSHEAALLMTLRLLAGSVQPVPTETQIVDALHEAGKTGVVYLASLLKNTGVDIQEFSIDLTVEVTIAPDKAN